MVEVPADTPDTVPVDEPTVATAVVLLYQLPPDELLLSVVAVPMHTFRPPVMLAGSGFTITVLVAVEEHAPVVAETLYTTIAGVITVVGYT